MTQINEMPMEQESSKAAESGTSTFGKSPADPQLRDGLKAVLIDLDGTLIDHFTTIYRCCSYAAEQMGLPVASYEKVRATVGGSLPVTLSKLLGPDNAEEGARLFHEKFREIYLDDLEVLPGAMWFVQGLKEQGYKTAVFTNKEGENARLVCEHIGLAAHFDVISGTRDTPYRKPEPEFTRHVFALLDVTAGQACMVGDSPYDVQTAHNAGIPCYTVATGSHSLEQLVETAADGAWPDLFALGEELFGIARSEEGA